MKLNEFVALMERIAPPQLAIAEDNIGLLIGPDHDEVRRVLVALDLTVRVASEAAAIGADLVLTHHPQFFQGVKRMLPDHPDSAAAYALIRHGIGHYAAHTNYDAAPGGVNDVLAELFGLTGIAPLPPGFGHHAPAHVQSKVSTPVGKGSLTCTLANGRDPALITSMV